MTSVNRHPFWLLALLVLAVPASFTVPCEAQQERKPVLILHSYHKADWTDSLLEGIGSVLGQMNEVDLAVEYMDTKRIKNEAYYQVLESVYRLKYQKLRFSALLTTDDNAYRFALTRQDTLFKGAPIVFCGVNRFDPREIENNPLVTGVVEKGDFAETLAYAFGSRPAATTVHLIVDHTRTAQINRQGFMAVVGQLLPHVAVRDLIDMSVNDLGTTLAGLPENDFAFFISYWLDNEGGAVSPDSLSTAFYRSSVPIFGRSEWMMGKGLTGGKCVTGFHQGQEAGRLVARILNGEKPADIPVNLNSPNRFMFDYQLLVRYGIDPSVLPADAIVLNGPGPSFYHKYRTLIWAVIAVVVTLLTLVAFLAATVLHRRTIEKALRESERRFHTLIEHAADAIFLTDPGGQMVDVNRQACESLGYKREELINSNVTEIDVNFDTRELVEALWEKMQSGRPEELETLHRRKDGSVFPVHVRIGRLEIDGKPYALALAHDITAQKKIRAELRESEARYRQLVQYAPAGIYEIDLVRGRFLSVNDVVCTFTGYTREELMALDPMELVAEESIPVVQGILDRLSADNPTPPAVEYWSKGKDGRRFWVMANSRFTFKEGTPVKMTSVVHDLTALRKAEEEKKRLEAKLAQIQKIESLGTLAGGIAHDFNNLLMGIQGNASLMLLDEGRSREDMTQLRSIERYVRRGVHLTRQLLGLSREGKYEVKSTDLNRLVSESAEMFSRTQKQIRIHQSFQEKLWSVECDQGQIDQVLLNLFVNAAQAMPEGGDLRIQTENCMLDAAQVHPHDLPEGRYVKIAVTDTGIGMDPATQAKIFDPFFTTKERERGTGLGLASAYGIIRNHGGFIDVASRPGQGSTFTLFLQASDKPVKGEKSADERIMRGHERILLVDDETPVLKVGQKILEKLGYEVMTAQTGAEALDIFRQNNGRIDLVVLDMIMPDMSGAETFKRMQEADPDVRVLLSSGYSADGQAAKILDQGCRGFIQKPFRLNEISQKIRQIIEA